MRAQLVGIEYSLPEGILTNADLAKEFPDWSVDKIEAKTGIASRHISADGQCASDLAFEAAEKLFESGEFQRDEIDFVLFCTQGPDYILPTTACILQNRLKIPTTAGALDFNLGCSGFVYGLGLAKGLIESGQAKNILFLTGDTYTKYIGSQDRSTRTLFGDAGAAAIIRAGEGETGLDELTFGTDGAGAENLAILGGGQRKPSEKIELQMNGPEIFHFTLETVPKAVNGMLERAQCDLSDVDCFVFHQANEFMLEHLRKKIGIPSEKFYIAMRELGNTVSCSIPIALKHAVSDKTISKGDRVMLVGFGVGYSWAASMIKWAF